MILTLLNHYWGKGECKIFILSIKVTYFLLLYPSSTNWLGKEKSPIVAWFSLQIQCAIYAS
jgi:hypothetical protein